MKLDLNGSCLCGQHQFRASGEMMGFYHCHCSRCRKANGTDHATNVLLKPATLELAGQPEDIGLYKVPEAERFANRFCKNCGSPLPRTNRKQGLVVVAAGTVDSGLEANPQCRIFWDSRAEWSCTDENLPIFSEYPPGRQ